MNVLFIVGGYRSGTTLLRLMLSCHPSIHMPPETSILPRMLEKYQGNCFRKEARDAIPAYLEFKHSCVLQGWAEFPSIDDVHSYLDATFDISKLYQAIIRSHADLCEKDGPIWIGDNTPAYILSLGMIMSHFPNAKIVHMIRDVRDVIASVKSAPFRSCFNIESCAYEWLERVYNGVSAEKWLGNEQLLTVKYEELVTNPEPVLVEICKFLNVDYEVGMLSYYTGRDARLMSEQSHHKNAIAPVTTASIGKYGRKLSKKEIEKIESITYMPLKAFGYSVEPPRVSSQSCMQKYLKFTTNYFLLILFRFWTAFRTLIRYKVQ